MLGVCITLEAPDANVYGDRTVDLQEWRESLKILGCTDLYVINATGHDISFQDDYVTLHEVTKPPAGTLVYFDPLGEIDIVSYQHPKGDVTYVFGPDSTGLNLVDKSKAVSIPSTNEYHETWALCASNIALYDRIAKA